MQFEPTHTSPHKTQKQQLTSAGSACSGQLYTQILAVSLQLSVWRSAGSCCGRLEAKREENEQKARRLAEKFADLKKAAEAANQAKEQAWERAKEAGTSAEQCAPCLALGRRFLPQINATGTRHLACFWAAPLGCAATRMLCTLLPT